MKTIFQKSSFPRTPGGDRYEWQEAETTFEASKDGFFVIKIQASAKNAERKRGTDDDDLRVTLNGFDFGKYEIHEEQISWKGFGTSASWDGASLRGSTKTIYFFVELRKGSHKLQFFADQTPSLKTIEVSEIKNNQFELSGLKPNTPIKSDIQGIPWLSFIFLGSLTRTFTLGVRTRSATSKKTSDGDNLKVVVNGKVLQNPVAPSSNRYKNFYFSGNLKETDLLIITHEYLSEPPSMAFENAVELWYDEKPEIENLKIEFLNQKELTKNLESLGLDFKKLKTQIAQKIRLAVFYFRNITKNNYSADFLEHSLENNPAPLIFKGGEPIIQKIKKDPIYPKILRKLTEKIQQGKLNGEIWPKDFDNDPEMNGKINFDSKDLSTSLHGIQKIEYEAIPENRNHYKVKMTFLDVYDFQKIEVPFFLLHLKHSLANYMNNQIDAGEGLGIIHNFEIQIYITETINI